MPAKPSAPPAKGVSDPYANLEQMRKDYAEARINLWHRWAVWLAIANGAALAAVGGGLLSKDLADGYRPLLLVAGWIFAAGLIFAGLHTRRWHRATEAAEEYVTALIPTVAYMDEPDSNPIAKAIRANSDAAWRTMKRRRRATRGLGDISVPVRRGPNLRPRCRHSS